jgi:hypothetical protein
MKYDTVANYKQSRRWLILWIYLWEPSSARQRLDKHVPTVTKLFALQRLQTVAVLEEPPKPSSRNAGQPPVQHLFQPAPTQHSSHSCRPAGVRPELRSPPRRPHLRSRTSAVACGRNYNSRQYWASTGNREPLPTGGSTQQQAPPPPQQLEEPAFTVPSRSSKLQRRSP